LTALEDGGFAVAWTRFFSGGDVDIRAAIYNANGSVRVEQLDVDLRGAASTGPAIAGLAGGGFVIVYADEPAAGGESDLRMRRYDAAGNPLDGNSVVLASLGTQNFGPQVVALQDGGFAVAYVSDSWGTGDDEITLTICNANGTVRAERHVNLDYVSGDQSRPTVTQLSNGFVVVGWSQGRDFFDQIFTAEGDAVGDNYYVYSEVVEGEILGLAGGLMANVRTSTLNDGADEGDTSIRASVQELIRHVLGDASNEALNGDALSDEVQGKAGKDKISGFAGKDTLDGGEGDDVLRGGIDRDQLIGGAGLDKFVYSDVLQSRAGLGADVVRDFEDGIDLIDVGGVDARADKAGDQAFKLIHGAFTAEGQVRVVDDGKDATLQFNTVGANGVDMEIVLKNFDHRDISEADFVL
jgi:Ca2+-binding RTX toxin-like protein